MKKIMPYQRLKNRFEDFVRKCRHKKMINRFRHHRIKHINDNTSKGLKDLYKGIAAVKQLGFDVHLTATKSILKVKPDEELSPISFI
jgi:hypothetical protein